MDEIGFAIGVGEAERCIINAQVRQKYQAMPGHQEWVSVIECVCADGTVVPPLVIFMAENLSTQWIPVNIQGIWKFSFNFKEWTSNIHGVEWLRRCFEPATCEKAAREYRLLIFDGHDSHITGEFVAHCTENNIIPMILPPHSSHLTQPLNVGIFGPLKKHMSAKIDPLIRMGVPRIQKIEWLAAFVSAHNQAVCHRNILGGFRGTGIYPFSPNKVLNRIDPPPNSETSMQQIVTPIKATPFNEIILTSSPNDIKAVHKANVALAADLDSGNPLSPPEKKFIKCQGQFIERLYASNSILQVDNAAKDAVIGARKRRLSNKRKSIDGKHVISAEELIAIRNAEQVTKKRKTIKLGASKRMQTKSTRPSGDGPGKDFSMTGDEVDLEILDNIEVEMKPH